MAPGILLIEDDAAFRKALATLLREEGFALEEAAAGKVGIAAALVRRPDLVILDLNLPGIRGEQVCCLSGEWLITVDGRGYALKSGKPE